MKNTKLLAARVEAWQEFKIRKVAQEWGLPLGQVLGTAIQIYCNTIVPSQVIQRWLKEYQESSKNVD